MTTGKDDHDTMRVHTVGDGTLSVNHVGYRDGRRLYDVVLRGAGQMFSYQRGMVPYLMKDAQQFTTGENAQRVLDFELMCIREAFNPDSEMGIAVKYPAWVNHVFNGVMEEGEK